VQIALAALRQGPLVRFGRHWVYRQRRRRRRFSNHTIRALLDAGDAVRQGDVVELRR
jgi:hypothetical protein